MALEVFRKIQAGKEATRGTAVAADKKLIGTMSLTTSRPTSMPRDERGSLAEYRRIREMSQGVKFKI